MVVGIILVLFLAFAVVAVIHDKRAGIPLPHERKMAAKAAADANLLCPHCQARGRVTSRPIKQKKGISGGKATGAVLTGGISILGTGLSRKEAHTEMTCGNCRTKWVV